MSALDILIAIGIVAVVLVALYAIAKGRGFKFAAQRGKAKLELDIAEKQEDSAKSSSGPGSINHISTLNKGNVEHSNVNIHVGHNIKKKKD